MIEAENRPLNGRNRPVPKQGGFGRADPVRAHLEQRHYTVAEIGAILHLSDDAIRKLFEREPGVIVIGDSAPRGKRRYTTLRIPQSVWERVYRRLCNL
jgi:hypothetical protein